MIKKQSGCFLEHGV